jgi:glycosyltransferase involved in cell wall biosynthesis
VGTGEHARITLVLPTYNRAGALRANLETMLAMRDVAEVIIVNDGSTDETVEVCRQLGDERVHVITHPQNRGVVAARNTGVDAAHGAWVLFGEDDCRFPLDYAVVLRDEAERHGADIVGAPLIYFDGTDADAPRFAANARRSALAPTMDDSGVFPLVPVETPFLPARVLVRRSVFAQVRFYDGFPFNGYREETDFFVQAARGGFHCLLTPATYCYQLENWRGGQHHGSSLRYEYWALRNNWRFLRRHGSWLTDQGYIGGLSTAQLRFAGMRARLTASGVTQARLRAARNVLRGGAHPVGG